MTPDSGILAGFGQALWEEVEIVTKGANYGWCIKEGTHWFNPDDQSHPPTTGTNAMPVVTR